MNKLHQEDKKQLQSYNRKTTYQEKKVMKYMNNIVKYNVVFMYHSSKNKTQFTDQCMKMFKNYGNKSNIKIVCKELYNVFKELKNKKHNTRKPDRIQTHKLKILLHSLNNNKKGQKRKTYKKLKGGDVEGPYLQRLTTKGDKPITGDDMAKAIDEVMTLLDDIQYLDDAPNVKGFNALFKFFNGDPEGLKSHLRYVIGPQFYSNFPPSINFGKLFERWDNIVDILNSYKNDRKIKMQFAVDKGLKPEDVLKPTFLDKFADRLDTFDQKFQKAKMVSKGNFII
tara:strand:- start:978 stop:1823 length:846 start_codon:yes stop_codon:yes gene_type:complete